MGTFWAIPHDFGIAVFLMRWSKTGKTQDPLFDKFNVRPRTLNQDDHISLHRGRDRIKRRDYDRGNPLQPPEPRKNQTDSKVTRK